MATMTRPPHPVGVRAWIAALLASASCSALAGEISWHDFLSQYEPAAARLAEVYQRAQIEARVTKSAFARRADTSEQLVVGTRDSSVRIERMPESGGPTGDVRVADPRISFRLQAGDNEPYRLEDLSSDYQNALENARLSCRLVSAPYGIFETTLLDLFRRPTFRATSVTQSEERDGAGLVRIEFISGPGGARQQKGELTLDPRRGWALVGYHLLLGDAKDDEPDLRADLEYGGELDGVPILKSAEYYYASPSRKINVERYDVTRFDPTPPPASDFTLQAFGLPDVQGPTPGPGRYTILLVGLALLAVGVVLRLWVARR